MTKNEREVVNLLRIFPPRLACVAWGRKEGQQSWARAWRPSRPRGEPAFRTSSRWWTVRFDDRLLKEPDADLGKRALQLLTLRLVDIQLAVPADKLARLQRGAIWLDAAQYQPNVPTIWDRLARLCARRPAPPLHGSHCCQSASDTSTGEVAVIDTSGCRPDARWRCRFARGGRSDRSGQR